MKEPSSPILKIALLGLIILSALSLFQILDSLIRNPSDLFGFGRIDSMEYWSAFKIFTQSGDPYSDIQMLEIQSAVRESQQPIMMWNPPWLLTTMSALLQIDSFNLFSLVWFYSGVLAYLTASFIIIRIFAFNYKYNLRLWTLILSYPSLISCLSYGQVSNWLFLGISLLLLGIKHHSALILALGLLLTSFKPHLFAALIPLAIWEFTRHKKYHLLAFKSVLTFAAMILPAIITNPIALKSWLANFTGLTVPTLATAKDSWKNTSLPSFFRTLTGINPGYFLYAIASIITIYALIIAIPKLKNLPPINKFIFIQAVSLPVIPFAWFYDYVILVPTLIIFWSQIAQDAKLTRWLFMMQVAALAYSSRFMPTQQHGLMVVLPYCILFVVLSLATIPRNVKADYET